MDVMSERVIILLLRKPGHFDGNNQRNAAAIAALARWRAHPPSLLQQAGEEEGDTQQRLRQFNTRCQALILSIIVALDHRSTTKHYLISGLAVEVQKRSPADAVRRRCHRPCLVAHRRGGSADQSRRQLRATAAHR